MQPCCHENSSDLSEETSVATGDATKKYSSLQKIKDLCIGKGLYYKDGYDVNPVQFLAGYIFQDCLVLFLYPAWILQILELRLLILKQANLPAKFR